ncbi:MAG: flavodoxin [Candidatus Freyarchaeota archaeon]|nr:flavodoxin [Candidatus Jordarchaeia archaeon]MBS7268075.1 flavodoxin [Candidatus Jordarchaeia archaeon]MBS7279094.1 flavodoxin [Candidatus Jordarchaeia archaeon]
MKVLVAYWTQTGNTKKIAEAIFGEIKGKKELKELDEVESLEGYDLAFIGFPINAFGPAAPAKKFLEKNVKGKNIALFVTHAAPDKKEDFERYGLDFEEFQGWLERCKEPAAEANLVGFFDCQGELSEQIANFLKKQEDPKLRTFGEFRDKTLGQPDASRIERARIFAREILKKFKA